MGSGIAADHASSNATTPNYDSLHEACHDKMAAHLYSGLGPSSQPSRHTVLAATSTIMETKSQRPKEREGVVSTLNAAIDALNLAKELSSVTPAKAVFGSVSIVLAMIKVSFLLVLRRPTAG